MPMPRLMAHLFHAGIAIAVSMLSLTILIRLLSTNSSLQGFNLYVIPACIFAGYLPLWRWYPRDAYPIGLAFCPAMFFILRYVAEPLAQFVRQ